MSEKWKVGNEWLPYHPSASHVPPGYRDGWNAAYRAAARAAQEAAAECDRCKQWVADLQSGMYVNCVYCGHRYGPEKDTPASMADVLKAHVEQCPKHPMSALKAERDETQQLCDKLAALLDQIAIAVNGPEPPLTKWSFHDLPEKVAASRERCKALEERLAWSAACWDDAARVMRKFGSEDEANECDENAARCRALLRQGDAAGGES